MADIMLSRWASLYANQTVAEMALEPEIAKLGIPYRFQHPIWSLRLFPDFVLLGPRLVIEVDDKSHLSTKKKAADAERTGRLNSRGWKVVRCSNEDAIKDPAGTLVRLLTEAKLEHLIKKG